MASRPGTLTEENHLADIPGKVVEQGTLAGRPVPQVQVDSVADHQEVDGQHHQAEPEEDPQLGGTLSALLDPQKGKGNAEERLLVQKGNHPQENTIGQLVLTGLKAIVLKETNATFGIHQIDYCVPIGML